VLRARSKRTDARAWSEAAAHHADSRAETCAS